LYYASHVSPGGLYENPPFSRPFYFRREPARPREAEPPEFAVSIAPARFTKSLPQRPKQNYDARAMSSNRKSREIGRASTTFDSHAALVEIRDSLLEIYAANDSMNQLIPSDLDPRAWRAQPPGKKGSGRPIATIFARLAHAQPLFVTAS
jgi:hypothetical protein